MGQHFRHVNLKCRVSFVPIEPYDVVINAWTCSSASGTFAAPTTEITDCYFEDSDGHEFHAATINNDDPDPGDWNATDFPELPDGTYNLIAEGDDGSSYEVGPFECSPETGTLRVGRRKRMSS